MSECGVLDLSGYGSLGAETTVTQRQRARMSRFFKQNPKLMAAAAALSFSRGRFAQNHPLVMANRMLKDRAQTAIQSKLVAKMTGVPTYTSDTTAPGAIRTDYTPGAFVRKRGWWPGSAVAADTKAPWENVGSVSGVQAKIRG